jgi:hemerythrin
MSFMQWSNELSVNIALVDQQHMKLIAMLNKTWEATQERQGPDALSPVLAELLDYTNHHFGTEEGLFRVHRYPGYWEHKREHVALTTHTQEMNRRLTKGSLRPTELQEFLKTWLNDHIMASDRKFGPFLVSKGVR